jgi:dipeptidyl aminopeptidase/acylaminoacyl peptidase
LFNHAALASKLSESLKETVDPKSLPLENITVMKGDLMKFTAKGKRFSWKNGTGELTLRTEKEEGENDFEEKSPDGKWIAYAENYNLYIKSTTDGTLKQLSTKGVKNYEYASYYGWSDIIEGENGERPRRFAVRWSPDSKYIQTNICDLRGARKMYLLDWSVDTLYRAKLLGYFRGSPGDTTVVHHLPVVFDVAAGTERRLPILPVPHELGYAFEWMNTPGIAFMQIGERGYHKVSAVLVDVATGNTEHLFTEASPTNIDGFSWFLNEKKTRLFVTSEMKTGWKQIYGVDLKFPGTGINDPRDSEIAYKASQARPITSGNFFVNSIVYFDDKNAMLYFLAAGKEAGRNPYEQYLYRVSTSKKSPPFLLTPEPGNHEITLSPNRQFFTDVYSTPQQRTKSWLRELKTGKVLEELSKADISGLMNMKWSEPIEFKAVGKDGSSTIYGLLWKPTNFDASKKYPIIDNSYTGPHGQIVPRTFIRGINVNNQALAELGFIVMMVDGLGTAGRSKAFHDHSYKRMGYNLEDHVRAIRQLSAQYTWIDTTRVGIFGHSAGGYDAGHAMVQYPDFYKVAVASSADHDFRMEKAWWPEMYMGWPVDSTYQLQSTITMASKLKGKLLITHGGIDENVNPSATFKLAEMLVRADKQFDMLIFPSQRHGYSGPQQYYFTKRRWNYFVQHLRGEQPIWDFPWK